MDHVVGPFCGGYGGDQPGYPSLGANESGLVVVCEAFDDFEVVLEALVHGVFVVAAKHEGLDEHNFTVALLL